MSGAGGPPVARWFARHESARHESARHDMAQDGCETGAFPTREGRTLSRDLLRRILISASLYLFVAAAVMAAAFVLDRMDPDADGTVADLDSDPGAEILTTSATPWTQTR